jgi:hypothetical protein
VRGRRTGQRHHHRAALKNTASARRRASGPLALTVGGLTLLSGAATFAPWGASGERSRNSYEIVDIAERADVIPGSLAGVAQLWFLVPALCGVVLVAISLRLVRLAGVGAATLGGLVGAASVLVARSPLVLEPGAIIGAVAGGCTVIAGGAVLVTASRQGEGDERRMGSGQQ